MLATIAVVVLLIVTRVADRSPFARDVLLLSGLSLVTYALMLDWVFYGAERPQVVATASVLKVAVFAVGAVLLVHTPDQVWLAPVLQAAGEAAAPLLAGGYIARFGWLVPSLAGARALVRRALPIGVSQMMRAVNYWFSVVIVGVLLDDAAVGRFVAAQKLMLLAMGFAALYFYAYLPLVSQVFDRGAAMLERLLARSIRLTALVTLPLATGATLLAPRVIEVLYGRGYAGSVPVLRVLIWAVPLIIFGGHFRQTLLAANLQAIDLRWSTTAAVTNVIASMALIPAAGLAGAAWATTLSEAVLVTLGYASVSRRIIHVRVARALPRPAIAAALMAVVVWLVAPFGLVAAVASGVGVYVAALVAPGEMPLSDLT